MRSKILLSTLAFTSALMTTAAPAAMASSADEAQLQALRQEMAQMRREMMGQISSLKTRLAKSEATAHQAGTPHGKGTNYAANMPRHHYVESGPVDPSVQFNDSTAQTGRLKLQTSGTPVTDRGDVTSWKSFRQATRSDENVHIGGMIIGFPKGRFTVASEDAS